MDQAPPTTALSGMGAGGGLCTDPVDGSLYVADRTPTADRLQRITKDSKVSTVWTWPDKPGVAGCAAMDGTVLVNLVNTKQTVAVRLAPATGAVTGEPDVVRQDTHGHAWALRMSPDGNVWGATVNKTAGDAEKLDDVVFPLFPQGGGFPRNTPTTRADRPRASSWRTHAARGQPWPQAASTSSRTRAASAWPLVAFITAPTIAPAAATLPPRIFSATSGLAASASSTAAWISESSRTTRQPAGGHHLLGLALAGQHALDDLAGQLVGQLAVVDQRTTAATWAGRDRQLVEFDAGLVGLLHQEVSPPGAGLLAGRAVLDGRGDQFDRAGVDAGRASPRRRCPSRPESACGSTTVAREWSARSRSTSSRAGRDRLQVGLGEVPVVLRGLLGAARAGVAVLVKVPGLLDDSATGRPAPRPGAASRSGPPPRRSSAS